MSKSTDSFHPLDTERLPTGLVRTSRSVSVYESATKLHVVKGGALGLMLIEESEGETFAGLTRARIDLSPADAMHMAGLLIAAARKLNPNLPAQPEGVFEPQTPDTGRPLTGASEQRGGDWPSADEVRERLENLPPRAWMGGR